MGSPPLVLVVDDEPQIRTLVARCLEASGVRAVGAEHGAAALERARQQLRELALVITDLQMPEMDGLVLAQELRKLRPTLPILFMSAYSSPGRNAYTGCTQYGEVLRKPFGADALLAAVARALHPHGTPGAASA